MHVKAAAHRALIAAVFLASAASDVGQTQGRGGGNWPTVSGDAQRTAWMRTETKVSSAGMAKPGFQLLWTTKLDNQPRQLNSLTQPLLLQNIISYKGFKALAYVGGSADNVYSIDYDLNRLFWKTRLSSAVAPPASASLVCPGGLTAMTRAAVVSAPAPSGRGGGPGGGRGGGRGGGFGGNAPVANAVYAVSSGGKVHVLNPQTGDDLQPPVAFLPPNSKVIGSILVDNVLYAATADNCGGTANGVWAVDLASDAGPITTWETRGGGIAGSAGPAFGMNGLIYVAVGSGPPGGTGSSNAVVALEAKSLTLMDYFGAASPFTSSPVAFRHKGRDLVVAANKDGRLYLLDAASLGGADHATPLFKTAPYSSLADFPAGALASWEEQDGTRWVLAAAGGPIHADTTFPLVNGKVTTGSIVAFKVVDPDGALTLQPGWVSRDLVSPLPPMIMNDVVFAVASGEHRSSDPKVSVAERVRRSTPAVLYALDARTGKELWNSGSTIRSFVHAVPPSGGDSQVYVVTYDGTLYAFGLPLEH